jgi:hypothetical protein
MHGTETLSALPRISQDSPSPCATQDVQRPLVPHAQPIGYGPVPPEETQETSETFAGLTQQIEPELGPSGPDLPGLHH